MNGLIGKLLVREVFLATDFKLGDGFFNNGTALAAGRFNFIGKKFIDLTILLKKSISISEGK